MQLAETVISEHGASAKTQQTEAHANQCTSMTRPIAHCSSTASQLSWTASATTYQSKYCGYLLTVAVEMCPCVTAN